MQNPLKNHLTDKAYQFLIKNNLLREKGIRDYHIRKRFNELKQDYPTHLIIEMLQEQRDLEEKVLELDQDTAIEDEGEGSIYPYDPEFGDIEISDTPFSIRTLTIGIIPAALEYIGTPSITATGTDHHALFPINTAIKFSGTYP